MNAESRKKSGGTDRLPSAIGPYAIRERIGRGAMGVVYRAVDQRSKSEVALKVIASDLDGDAETRERFFREAHVAGRLRHRNIVTVLDNGEDGGRLYIAMELLSGATLAELLKGSNGLDLEDRIDMMIQVCQGLRVAHTAGVFHRDLKPANLFICDDRCIKLLDFGVARLVGSNMTVTGNIIGTPDFMSPEQVRGQEVDGRSDIFSLGSVFYLLLTGRKPFAANDLPTVLSKVVRAQPLPIRESEAPEPLAAVIRKAMTKDPAARQQDVGELAAELMAAASAIETDIRQTALNVRRMAEDMLQLVKQRSELSSELGLTNGADQDPWLALCEQYPILYAGPNVLGSFPLRSGLVGGLEIALRTELGALGPAVAQREEGYAKFTAGMALQEEGSHDLALAQYAAAQGLVPSSPVIARAAEECTRALEQQRDRDARLQARLTLANEAADRADWAALLAIVKEIEEVDPDNSIVEDLRSSAIRNLQAERARQTGGQPERKTGARATAVPLSPADIEREDPSPGVEGEIAVSGAEGTAQAARLDKEAPRQVSGDGSGTARRPSQSASLNADQTPQLLERVRTTIAQQEKLQAKKDEKSSRVMELMRSAQGLVDRKSFVKALQLIDEALMIDAGNLSAAALRARIVAERSAQDAAETAETARQRRLRAATPALREAQRAFQAGDLERARWSAENALAVAPDFLEATALLSEIAAVTPEPSPDDTVKLDDPLSETAQMAPVRPSVRERLTDLREQASALIRRWRSSKGHPKDQ